MTPIDFIKDFEKIISMAKARAYSKISEERELTDVEIYKFKDVMKDLVK